MPMRMPLVVLCVLAVTLVASAEQGSGGGQMMMPTPPKEMAKLDAMVGTWKGTGTFYGMGAPIQYDSVCKASKKFMGMYLVEEETDTATMPGMSAPMVVHDEMRVTWYDAAAKTYKVAAYDETGTPSVGTAHFDGNKFIAEVDMPSMGANQKFRATGTPDGKDSVKILGEISSDNFKTTTKFFEIAYKRAGGM